MDTQKFEEIISKVHKYTKMVCLHVKGEPLMHQDLNKILDILEKYNLKANITTNGTLIKQNLKTIKETNAVKQINFSIHSFNQNNNLSQKLTKKQFIFAKY